MADLSDSPSSGHGQAGSTMEAVSDGEDLEMQMPDAMRKLVEEFEEESSEMECKIHRVPASLADMGDQFILPMALAIGPYHRHLPRVQGMQKAKRVAVCTLTRDSGKSLEEMYSLVLAVADMGRRMYDDDGNDYMLSGDYSHELADMMFHDACFLLQYMLWLSLSPEVDAMSPLQRFFRANEACISNDIMLLENQLPWFVIEVLMTASATDRRDVDVFIAKMGNSMSNISRHERFLEDMVTRPAPHLLGRLVLHKQGVSLKGPAGLRALSAPIGTMELEGIGIKLDHSKTDEFSDIGMGKGLLFHKFFLPSLRLDRIRTTWLANMVALEVCTTSYSSESTNDSSLCSYVALLAMLMDREEDVHKLRSEGFIHGDLSDKQILEFFNGLAQKISPGICYFQMLAEIEACKRKRWLRIMVCKFFSSNGKAIAAVLSIIGVLVGIFKALYSLKQH